MLYQEKTYQIALCQTPGLGYKVASQLMHHFGTARAVYQSPAHMRMQVPGVGRQLAQAIGRRDALTQAVTLQEDHKNSQIHLITPWEPSYPERLKHIYGVPQLLYLRGDVHLNASKVIGVVGTRKATLYGKKMVEHLLYGLRDHAPLIVSGLAYGIDIHAHRTALSLGFPTLAVVAGGVDVIYPASHRRDIKMLLDTGGVLSEHPRQTSPEPYRFIARNRIIAGLSEATIVVEAGEKSGALITARYANEYNREVFAVCGPVDGPYSTGCHHLIKTHQAHLLTTADDLVRELNWGEVTSTSRVAIPASPSLTDTEAQIVAAIGQSTVSMDKLHDITKFPLEQLSPLLLGLELRKVVHALPGHGFKLR